MISPGAYFLVKGPFRQFFLGGGAYNWGGEGGLYMDEYLCFENIIFHSSNCNFFSFSAHNLSLLLIFFLTKCSVNTHTAWLNKIPTL